VERFWDFSVRTYRSDGVPEACLSAQNDYGADVNMLLYCCWVGVHAGRFDPALFDRATRFSECWSDGVVGPLRSARTWMKHAGCNAENMPTAACMSLREDIKHVEFAAEKMQEEVLESFAEVSRTGKAPDARVLAAVVANLMQYSVHAGLAVDADLRQKYAAIVCAAVPALERQTVARALRA